MSERMDGRSEDIDISAEEAAPQPDQDATAEEAPRHRRVWPYQVAGPLLALLVYFLLPDDPGLTPGARATAAVVTLVAFWWMSEALPLPATSLVPIVAFPLLGVLEAEDTTAAYAQPTVFLFLGGFVIALAMQKWNLHKRIALLVMRTIGTKPRQLIFGVMVATWFLSMWVSNTATTLMMLPIGLSVLALVAEHTPSTSPRIEEEHHQHALEEGAPVIELISGHDAADVDTANFETSLMLAIAYAATIGGLATLIGSPPNLIMSGFVDVTYGFEISFLEWMLLGVPLSAVFLVIAWLTLTRAIYPSKIDEISGGKQVIHDELAGLGKMSRGEWTVAVVFLVTALLWVFRQPLSESEAVTSILPFMANLSDAAIAIGAALALFLIPVSSRLGQAAMDWKTAQAGLPWGVLLLFGGGLALATGVAETGLAEYIGSKVSGLGALPTFLLVGAIALIVLLLTELTSNTATAATFLPVLGGVAVGIGIDPLVLLVPAAMAATCAFMLPVGTPPNAIVFGSGYVTIGQMVRAGIWLNLVGVLLITLFTFALGGWAMGIGIGR